MPSSMASLARKGGASAVSVAATSEATARAVRRRYGAVSRASVDTRRAVRAHDQSFTSAPRCAVRWEPGCQIFTAVLRCAAAVRLPGGRLLLHTRPRLDGKTHLPDPMARA